MRLAVERFMPALGLRIQAILDLQPAVPVVFAEAKTPAPNIKLLEAFAK